MYALIRKFAYTANSDNLGGCVAQLVEAQVCDGKVADSMPVLGINVNYLTSPL